VPHPATAQAEGVEAVLEVSEETSEAKGREAGELAGAGRERLKGSGPQSQLGQPLALPRQQSMALLGTDRFGRFFSTVGGEPRGEPCVVCCCRYWQGADALQEGVCWRYQEHD